MRRVRHAGPSAPHRAPVPARVCRPRGRWWRAVPLPRRAPAGPLRVLDVRRRRARAALPRRSSPGSRSGPGQAPSARARACRDPPRGSARRLVARPELDGKVALVTGAARRHDTEWRDRRLKDVAPTTAWAGSCTQDRATQPGLTPSRRLRRTRYAGSSLCAYACRDLGRCSTSLWANEADSPFVAVSMAPEVRQPLSHSPISSAGIGWHSR